MWAGGGLRVILDAKCGNGPAAKAFERVVIQVCVSYLDILILKRVNIYAESVVLTRYFNGTGLKILNGMVRTSVSEFQLKSTAAKGQAQQLMTEANSEDRHFA
jgi:hypothetical protein